MRILHPEREITDMRSKVLRVVDGVILGVLLTIVAVGRCEGERESASDGVQLANRAHGETATPPATSDVSPIVDSN